MSSKCNFIRKQIKNQIINCKNYEDFEKEHTEIYDLIVRTVQHGESNSALIIGPRGVGKTSLVDNVIAQIQDEGRFDSNAILVKLHGLIHTTDRLALNSINTQLNLETVVDGKIFGSFAENLQFLLSCLKCGNKSTAKSVVFILDEFDLFCGHHNQTLIYNLFDVSQSPQTPVCVIGITCRLDVIEQLEKRVKSRFSHRQIFLFPGNPDDNNQTNLNQALIRIKAYLQLPNLSKNISSSDRREWNASLSELLENKDFKNTIFRLISFDLAETTLKNFLLSTICEMKDDERTLNAKMFMESLKCFEMDDIVNVLLDLSVLELCLVIAMKHHIEIYEQNTMNFQMIYTRFMKFVNSNTNIQNSSKTVVLKAFEKLHSMQLIELHQGNTNQSVQKEYQLFKILILPEQIMEAIKRMNKLPTEVKQWSTRNI